MPKVSSKPYHKTKYASLKSYLKHPLLGIQRWKMRRYGEPFRYLPVALMVVIVIVAPILSEYDSGAYALTNTVQQLINLPDSHFAGSIRYSSSKQSYIVNAVSADNEATAGPMDQIGQPKQGLYTATLPVTLSHGLDIKDNVTNSEVSIKPQFAAGEGKHIASHIVYPLGSGTIQAVYTPEATGVAEDIVVNHYSGNALSFPYSLKLPKGDQAFSLKDGGIAVEKTGKVIFSLQTPIIKQSNGKPGGSAVKGAARLVLKGDNVYLFAAGLNKLSYPLTIDPSITVNSSTPMLVGNNEGGINLNNSQASTANLTGGGLSGGWTALNNLPTTLASSGVVTYNGYLYVMGGNTGSYTAGVQYTLIAANGTFTAPACSAPNWSISNSVWCYNANSLPTINNGGDAVAAAYDGYIYYFGGHLNGGTDTSDVYYTKANSDGSIGSWTVLKSNLPLIMDSETSETYNGYVYILGGNQNGAVSSSVYFARFSSSGTLVTTLTSCPAGGTLYNGTWCSTSSMPAVRENAVSAVVNGYIYELGGSNGSLNESNDYYAHINADGTLSAWITSPTSMPAVNSNGAGGTYNGYLYVMAGQTSSVYFISVNADGSLAPSWSATTSLPATNTYESGTVYNGYAYVIGGNTGSITAAVDYAKIDPSGYLSSPNTTINSWSTTTTLTPYAVTSKGHTTNYYPVNATSVVSGSNVYELGGNYTNGTTPNGPLNSVYYATIGNGLGTWTATTALPTATFGATSVAYDGYVYEFGGCTAGTTSCTTYTNAVYYDTASAGLGASWTTATSLPTAAYDSTAVMYNGYVYIVGGYNGSYLSSVSYAQLSPNGGFVSMASCPTGWTLSGGTWCYNSTALPTALDQSSAVVYGGNLYVIGGYNGSGTAAVSYTTLGSGGALGSMGSCPSGWTLSGTNWCTNSTSLSTGNWGAGAAAYNGYLYLLGGDTSGGYTQAVSYALINNDGSLASWNSNLAMPNTMYGATEAMYNNYIYDMGGYNNGSAAGSTYYAQINNGGSGTIASYTSTTSLYTTLDASASVAYNGYGYTIGGTTNGTNTGNVQTVSYAPLSSSGIGTQSTCPSGWTLSGSSWCYNTTSLPSALAYGSAVVYDNFVYYLGGQTAAGGFSNSVYYAPINTNGSIGSWSTSTSLPTATDDARDVEYNGYVYEIGGSNASGYSAEVSYAPLLKTGGLGTQSSCPSGWTLVSSTWCDNTTSLSNASDAPATVVYDGYIYKMGGKNTAYLNQVIYAKINSDGSLGAWTPTTSLPIATNLSVSISYDGYVYEVGGYDGTNHSTNVFYAPINGNGTLGNWSQASGLPTGTDTSAAVVYQGDLFMFGGNTSGGVVSTSDYATLQSIPRVGDYSMLVNMGQEIGSVSSGVNTWTPTSSMPNPNGYATSVTYSGYVYELGGYTGSGQIAAVAYAPLSSTGLGTQASCPTGWTLSNGTWCYNNTSLPYAADGSTAVTYNGYVYFMGGYNGTADQQAVSYAPLLTTGGLGTQTCPSGWTAYGSSWCENTTGLPAISEEASAVVFNGYIYQLGGYVSSAYSSAVYSAPINANGSIGTWTTLTALPSAFGYGSAVINNGYVYEIGGYNGTADTQTVSFAPLGSTGGLGTQASCPSGWTLSGGTWCYNATSLPYTTEGLTAVVANGYMYELGGYANGAYENFVFDAPINTDGSVGTWTQTASLPNDDYKATTVVNNNILYELGGYTDGAYLTNVYYATLATTQPIHVNVTPLSIITNGTNTGNPGNGGYNSFGGFSISYGNSMAQCTVLKYGDNVKLALPEITTPYNLAVSTDACGDSTQLADSIWVHYQIDDTQTATFPDVNSNHTSISGFQIFYDPNAGYRLRGGATFNNQTLQSLDAPPTTTQ